MDETKFTPVIILLITYRRLRLAVETINSVKANLIYPNVGFHIADDGSGPEYVDAVRDAIRPTYSISVSNGEQKGVGKNMNLGIHAVLDRADIWINSEDEWRLRGKFDLLP